MSERRAALITGCGKQDGIGAASARALSRAGFAVVVTDIAAAGAPDLNEPEARGGRWRGVASLVAEIKAAGGQALAALGDVAIEPQAKAMVAEAMDAFGRVDVLVNNAAAPFGLGHGDIEKIDAEAWDRVLSVNLKGTFLMCREVVPNMRQRRWGRIVNISSAAGRAGSSANAAYSAAKAGIIGFSRALAMDVAPDFITVNAVCPGMILTRRMRSGARARGGDEAVSLEAIARNTPISRPGMPEEVAALVAYLASDDAGFVTAQTLGIDGGTLRF